MAECSGGKRFVWALISALGCVCAFIGVLTGGDAMMQKMDTRQILSLVRENEVKLPCRVEETALIASQLVMYEGPFLETGGDEPVSDITALILYNSGECEIAQAEVVLTGEQKLTFFASNIMPGARVLVLEKNAAAWQQWNISSCSGWVNKETQPSIPEDWLQIEQVDMGTVAVTNISREKLTDICLFYKNYLEEGDLYVGGITYMKQIGSLEPGQSATVTLPRYAAGYSRIIKVQRLS